MGVYYKICGAYKKILVVLSVGSEELQRIDGKATFLNQVVSMILTLLIYLI